MNTLGKDGLFPERLGFGLLHSDSIVEREKSVQAKYYSKVGDLVYDISLGPDLCRIEEHFENRIIGTTQFKTLPEAFNQKFMSMARHPLDHPRFSRTIKRITKDRNVYFKPFGETKAVFFPAGLIFVLRLPIVGEEREELIRNKKFDFDCNLLGINEGSIIRLLVSTKEITIEDRRMADFSITLLDLEEAVDMFFSLGLVVDPEYIEYGLIIMNAAHAAEGAFQIYPGNNLRIHQYSLLLKRAGDISLERAIKLYEEKFSKKRRQEEPIDPVAYFDRGFKWQKKGDYDRAVDDYTTAIEIAGTYPVAYVNRGLCWQMKHDIDRAIDDYNKALEIDPHLALAYVNRGVCWQKHGDYNRAITDFDKALEIDPHHAGAYYNRAGSWFYEGDFRRALADVKKAVKIDPEDSKFREFMEYLGRWEKGRKPGEWIYTYPDGSKYEGEWKDGKRHGYGTWVWPDGLKLEGQWANDKQQGYGTSTHSDGAKYEGQWKDNEWDGHGTFTFPDGSKYEGEWKDGKENGYGTRNYLDGTQYKGEWKDGKYHGKGTQTLPDGDKYVGEFKDGKFHGKGVMTFPDGTKKVGEWIYGEFYK
ncbi:MAG: tetratricopeptide repeat protein [Planctomycetes bacterium]|nr:tetratricopeptide repeat protein [Planctomycetota bacterium]